jgi:predicted transcriptional regulator
LKVAEWIRCHPGLAITVAPDSSLEQVMDRMLEEPCLRDVYVVSKEGKLIGHLSHKKLIHFILAEHRPVHTRRQIMERIVGGLAEELMDTEVVYAKPDEELDNVLNRQLEQDIDDMPVIDDHGIMLGVLNMNAVLRQIRKNKKGITA